MAIKAKPHRGYKKRFTTTGRKKSGTQKNKLLHTKPESEISITEKAKNNARTRILFKKKNSCKNHRMDGKSTRTRKDKQDNNFAHKSDNKRIRAALYI